MNNKIIIINGPNLNLLGEREQSQYGSITFEQLKKKCAEHSKKIGVNASFFQSNIEGEIVNKIQDSRKSCDGNPQCFGVSWYEKNKKQKIRICRSTKMVPKNDGWRTMMKTGEFN